jgi:hypothetical protein
LLDSESYSIRVAAHLATAGWRSPFSTRALPRNRIPVLSGELRRKLESRLGRAYFRLWRMRWIFQSAAVVSSGLREQRSRPH